MKRIGPPIILITILIAIFVATKGNNTVTSYGKVVVEPGEKIMFKDFTLRVLEVTEDSRCAQGVQCIWVGTLKASVETQIGIDSPVIQSIELNNSVEVGGTSISLMAAEPAPKAGQIIDRDKYTLTFKVEKVGADSSSPEPITSGRCYIGGCSAQICSDQPDAVSTCEYTAAYACYQGAKCERQASGACGWTETPELKMCLSNAK